MPCTPSPWNSVTVEVPGLNPRATLSGVQVGSDSSSAKQKVYLPGLPNTARSTPPGMPPPTLRITSCSARPIVALARLPWPSALPPLFMPMRFAIGPLTMMTGPENHSVASRPCMENRGSSAVSITASTTGKVFRAAAGHHRVGGGLLHRALGEVGRNEADDLVRPARGAGRASSRPAAASAERPAARRTSRGRTRLRSRPPRRRRRCGASSRCRSPWASASRSGMPGSCVSDPQPGLKCRQSRRRAPVCCATCSHSARSQPAMRATSLSPSNRISVGTISMRRRHERSSAVSSSAPPSVSGKVGIVLAVERRAARGSRICASTGSTSLQVSHSRFTTATSFIPSFSTARVLPWAFSHAMRRARRAGRLPGSRYRPLNLHAWQKVPKLRAVDSKGPGRAL